MGGKDMTRMEIATYIGMANIMLAKAQEEMKNEDTEMIDKIREALCMAQLILTNQAIEEYKGDNNG